MSSQADRWAVARFRALTEFSDTINQVTEAMRVDFPKGSEDVRRFMAEDFVIRWVLFGSCLPE